MTTGRTITPAQLGRALGLRDEDVVDQVDVWLEAGAPAIRRDRVVLFDRHEILRWCATRGLYERPPFVFNLRDRYDGARTADDVDALAWDVGTLRERGAISRGYAAAWIDRLESLRAYLRDMRYDQDDEDRGAA